ncbi:MAG: hypothetical protein F6K40_38175 [Okeania sp. SIO3I5]|uniref:hypothetical protein n=1 Tax=Okeania sp. SIO3I5 TaxID=2607805 RepID=UPI0013B655C9|nr:hypothetical protein [Okeania sp. SIO3I5]NEQ41703.1 hypothetical protein [Okeania sp. SIO3I5]NEQ41704.1 hypothetical protein [Okeania sp. SIO3I5]
MEKTSPPQPFFLVGKGEYLSPFFAKIAVGVIFDNQTNSNFFYNQNGVANGFGEGDLLANFANILELESSENQMR